MNVSKFNWNGQNHTFSARVCSFISSSAAIRHLTPGFPLSCLLCGPQSLSAHLAERLLEDYQEKLDAGYVWRQNKTLLEDPDDQGKPWFNRRAGRSKSQG